MKIIALIIIHWTSGQLSKSHGMVKNSDDEDGAPFLSVPFHRRRFSRVILTFTCCLVVLVAAVLYLTPTKDDNVLMQKLWAKKSPVRYYWIPKSSSSMKIRPGQVLEEESAPAATGAESAEKEAKADEDTPPYGESVDNPDAECDIAQMADCLGALESQIESLKEVTESSAETADYFCRNMKEPFQCACKACKLDQLGNWDYMYYHSNITDRAKQLLSHMRVDAQCQKLRSIGAEYFPAGHGCNMLYSTVCTDPQMVGPYLRPHRYFNQPSFLPFPTRVGHECSSALSSRRRRRRRRR
jgi:hypothetical protein